MTSPVRITSAIAFAAILLAACGGSATPAAPAYSSASSPAASSSAPVSASSPAASSGTASSVSPAASTSGSASGSAAAAAQPAAAPPPPITAVMVKEDAKLGKFLTDERGMTLYTFTKDQKGVSNCSGGCAVLWPPAAAATTPPLPGGTPGTLDLISRQDGAKQLTYNGLPLYFYASDHQPGDTKGEGVGGGVWHVAAVAAA